MYIKVLVVAGAKKAEIVKRKIDSYKVSVKEKRREIWQIRQCARLLRNISKLMKSGLEL